MFIKEIVGDERSLEEVYDILFKHYTSTASDLLGCEPTCRNPGKECCECVEEYLKNSILWINSDNAGVRQRTYYRGTKHLWDSENTRGELVK